MRPLPRTVLAVLLATGSAAVAATDYSESAQGDLSNDRLRPTVIALSMGAPGANGRAGNNVLTGATGRSAGGTVDRDYFTVIVPAGHVLSALRVGNQTTVGGGGSFIGMAAGGTMPVAENAGSAAGLLGWKVYALADRNTDILDNLAVSGNGAAGFTAPLGAGAYTFWVQELATGSFNYRFNLVLSPVPEPAGWLMLLAGAALLGARARRIALPT
ncbi:MAG: PEP-CTERM sorting domain-containing protein [Burkholderiales bacterium]|nr:PEP-CTERM sorting domain-containing protein [Burkholderiales bacterium]